MIHEDRTVGEDAALALIRTIPETLSPVLDRAKRGQYEPDVRSFVDGEEMIAALSAVTGSPIRNIRLVSFGRSGAHRPWAARTHYRRTLSDALEQQHGFRLMLELGGARWKRMRDRFGYNDVVTLHEHLQAAGVRIPRENFRASIFHLYALFFTKTAERADDLRRLIAFFPRALPLGELASEPGVWTVLIA